MKKLANQRNVPQRKTKMMHLVRRACVHICRFILTCVSGSSPRSHSPLPGDGGKVGPPKKRKKQAILAAKPVAPVEPPSSPVTETTNLDSDSDADIAPKRLTKRKRRAVQEDEDEDDAPAAPASSSPPPTAAEEEDEEMADDDEGESEIEQVENKKGATKRYVLVYRRKSV